METDHNIEQLFREGLAEHRKTPPDHLWQSIAAGAGIPAPPLNGKNGTRKGIWWWIPSSLIVLLLVGGLILLNSSPDKPSEQHTATLPVVAAYETTLPASVSSDPLVSTSIHKTEVVAPTVVTPISRESGPEDQHMVSQSPANPQPEIAYAINTSTLTEEQIAEEKIITSSEQSTPLDITPETTTSATAETPIPIRVIKNPDVEAIQIPIEEMDTLLRSAQDTLPVTIKNINNQHFPDYPALGLALHGGPFLYQTFNPYPEEYRAASDFLLSMELKYRRFSLTTGAGIFRVSDKTPWTGQRMQLDTVGYYQYVTGVTFMPVYHPIDSTILGYITDNISTVTTPAVDTSIHLVEFTARHRYTYFALPVMVGYDVWNRNKITTMVQAGVIYNLKMFERQSMPKEAGEPLMISMESQGLIRKEQLWQYQAGLGVRYDLRGAWYAGADLAVRRNLSGWYRDPQLSEPTPTSILLRATVGIWL